MSVFFAQKGKGRRGIDHEKKNWNIDMNGWIIMDGWMDGWMDKLSNKNDIYNIPLIHRTDDFETIKKKVHIMIPANKHFQQETFNRKKRIILYT